MDRPNIFDFATKELSQDAVVCWLLDCIKYEDYRKLGTNFIKYLIGYDSNTIELEPLKKQYKSMDVFATAKIDNKPNYFIFEDKTNTFIHNNKKKGTNQVSDYIDKVFQDNDYKANEGQVWFIYYKTGYVPDWQKKELNNIFDNVKEKYDNNLHCKDIYIEDMINFLARNNGLFKNTIIEDYYLYLKKLSDEMKDAYENALTTEPEKWLDIYWKESACSRLFEEAFGKNNKFHYDHQGWASYDIFKIKLDDEWVTYCFRFEKCKNKKGNNKSFAFQFQQYREEKKEIVNCENKLKQAQNVMDICRKVFDNNGVIDISECDLDSTKRYNGKMLFKIFIYGDNTPEKVCGYIKEFTKNICQEIQNQYDESKCEILIKESL